MTVRMLYNARNEEEAEERAVRIFIAGLAAAAALAVAVAVFVVLAEGGYLK